MKSSFQAADSQCLIFCRYTPKNIRPFFANLITQAVSGDNDIFSDGMLNHLPATPLIMLETVHTLWKVTVLAPKSSGSV